MFFPLDTIKTRVQSSAGFWASGGFKGVYRGVGSVGFGSAPGGEYRRRDLVNWT
jgi:solute carrier family 25 S-adenosylmethionine transporter 26